jgi:hypothetical protein
MRRRAQIAGPDRRHNRYPLSPAEGVLQHNRRLQPSGMRKYRSLRDDVGNACNEAEVPTRPFPLTLSLVSPYLVARFGPISSCPICSLPWRHASADVTSLDHAARGSRT